jgi:signal transduction histidine kinase
MTDSQAIESSRSPQSSQIAALGSLVAARDLEELVLAAALIPAQLLSAREAIVVLQAPSVSSSAEIIQRQPSSISGALEAWAKSHLESGGNARREGSWLSVGIEPIDGWSGVIAIDSAAPDEETQRGLNELGSIVSRCVAQIAGLRRRDTALEDARKSIGKGLHDLRTPLNSLRLGLHLLEPGLAGQDPQVVQRTHRAVDRLAALVTEMYEALHEKTATR